MGQEKLHIEYLPRQVGREGGGGGGGGGEWDAPGLRYPLTGCGSLVLGTLRVFQMLLFLNI